MRRLVVLLFVVAACAQANQNAPDAGPPDAVPIDACVPATETCNGMDDDCDTSIDEDIAMLGDDCMVGNGQCTAAGHYVCADQGGVVCDASSGTPAGELCNGLDDDCDTLIDEGLDVGTACDGVDSDACAEGVIACLNDAAVCDDATADSVEQCNSLDDDCQNGADDLWPIGQPCSAGVGACAASGTYQCNSLSTAACDAVAGAPTPEFCGDGVDQDCSGADVSCPTNDLASGAIDISAGGTFSVDLSAAHDDNAGTCGSTGGRDVFYKFTLPAAEVVYVDTFSSSFDTTVRIFSGACTALGAQQACFDDSGCTNNSLQSQGAQNLAAGTYCLVADQYSSSQTTGNLVLKFTRGGRSGAAVSGATGSHTQAGNTSGLTNIQTSSCAPNSTGPDQGWFFTECPATTRSLTASTCGGATWDTIVTLSGPNVSGCNDDAGSTACSANSLASTMPATSLTGPGLFWLVVDGYNGASGAYTLTYSM